MSQEKMPVSTLPSKEDESIGEVALTEEECINEKHLVRRIDFMILPLVILVYLMNYIDR
jgi:hypothetical protein